MGGALAMPGAWWGHLLLVPPAALRHSSPLEWVWAPGMFYMKHPPRPHLSCPSQLPLGVAALELEERRKTAGE